MKKLFFVFFLVVPIQTQAQTGVIEKAGFKFNGLYLGGQMVDDFKTPFAQPSLALTANAIIGFRRYYSLQFQIISPALVGFRGQKRSPLLFRLAVDAKLL